MKLGWVGSLTLRLTVVVIILAGPARKVEWCEFIKRKGCSPALVIWDQVSRWALS